MKGWNEKTIKKFADRISDSSPRKKQDRSNALGATAEDPQFSKGVHITISVWKTGGNWDADNIETKAYIDGLVACGVIKDDTIKEVPVVTRKGYRVATKADEKTEIEITEI